MSFQPTPEEQHFSDEGHVVLDNVYPLVKEAKAGYKTTEFWLTIAGALLINVNALPLPDRYQGAVTLALVAAYNIARGIAKSGVPNVEDPKV